MKGSWTAALGLMLLLEGIFPFLFPTQWRETLNRITRFSDGQIPFLGLIALSCGALVLGLVELFS